MEEADEREQRARAEQAAEAAAASFGAFGEEEEEEDEEEEEEEEMDDEEQREMEEEMGLDGPRGISHTNASRLLEALEALSGDSQAQGFPQMLRGLLGQLQVPPGEPHAGGSTPPPRTEATRQLSGFFPVNQLFEGGNPRYQRLLRGLQAEASMSMQMECLSELCETLSLTTEEILTLSSFDVHGFTRAIVALIRAPACVEIALLATRALWMLLDYFPMKVVPKAVDEGLLAALCSKLLEIEYMDIAELSFQILERICTLENDLTLASNRRILVKENGIVAMLQFVDFFPIEIQRTAIRIVRELCTDFPFEEELCRDRLADGMTNLLQLLNSSDVEIRATTCEALKRLSESGSFGLNKQFVCGHVAQESICDTLVRILESQIALSETVEDSSSATSLSDASAQNASESVLTESFQHKSVMLTSILQFFRQIIYQLGDADQQMGGPQSHLAKLCTTQLPLIVTRLMALEAQPLRGGDSQVIQETLKLVIELLPWSIRSLGNQLSTTPGSSQELLNHWAREILPLVFHVCDLTDRKELRHDCLRVVHGGLALLLARYGLINEAVRVSTKEAFGLSVFLARMLRPSLVDLSQNDARNVVLALEIVQSALSAHRFMFAGLFERCGVTRCVRFYAERSLCTNWFDSKNRSSEALEEVIALAKRIGEEFCHNHLGDQTKAMSLKQIVDDLEASLVDSSKLDAALDRLHSVVDQRLLQSAGLPALSPFEMYSSGFTKTLIRLFQNEQVTQTLKHQFLRGVAWEQVLVELTNTLQQAISCEKNTFFVEERPPEQVLKEFERLVQHLKVRVLIEDAKQDQSSDDPSSSIVGATSSQALLAHRRRRRLARLHDTIVLVEPLARVETMEEFVNEKLFGGTNANRTGNDEANGEADSRAMVEEEKEHEVEQEAVQSEDNDPDSVQAPRTSSPPPDRSDRKVLGFYKNKQLDGGMSLLEAIFRTELALKASSESGRSQSWQDFHWPWTNGAHDITFRVVSTGSATAQNKSEQQGCSASEETTNGAKRAELSELHPAWGWWDNAWDLISALKLVRDHLLLLRYWRVSSSPTMAPIADGISNQVACMSFVNEFLSAQLNRVLQAPLVVVMHLIPEWCFRVLDEFGFCVQFETKYHFMFATSCGLPRAIQHLSKTLWKQVVKEADMAQLRRDTNTPLDSPPSDLAPSSTGSSDSSSSTSSTSSRPPRRRDLRRPRHHSNSMKTLENLMRIIKLPRLKVRVSRAKVLASAMKLLEIYGGQKALIEVEFLGEVGTGLGPTTEFFTITCAEIQARDLKLWRDDEAPQNAAAHHVDVGNNNSFSLAGTTSGVSHGTPPDSNVSSIPVKGYHRIAVYWCRDCTRIDFPHCQEHARLLTLEAVHPEDPEKTIPQCSECRETREFHHEYGRQCAWCASKTSSLSKSKSNEQAQRGCQVLKWWILSEEEVQYLKKVYPRDKTSLAHPILQCAHCSTVNFPGTVAGIVVLQDGDRMISKSGRRMYERDYRSVTKHVSPLCEGTPLKQLNCLLRREQVDLLVDLIHKSPEVMENEIDAFEYVAEAVSSSKEGKHASSCGSSVAFEPVKAPYGLYPRPLAVVPEGEPLLKPKAQEHEVEPQSTKQKMTQLAVNSPRSRRRMSNRVIDYFQFLGCFVAQALLDERLLNLPLSTTFFRNVTNRFDHLDQDLALGCFYVHEMDPVLGKSLQFLYDLNLQLAHAQALADEQQITVVKQQIDAMALDFSLIGSSNPPIELVPNGSTVAVNANNLVHYLQLTVDFVLRKAIERQVEAFRKGFDALLAGRVLRWFELDELALLFYDSDAKPLWTADQLQKCMVCDHGFTRQSVQIHWLIKILCELTKEEQRLFLRFVTGADRLPLGGLQALEPHLTVVRKLSPPSDPNHPVDDDQVLPSASTCTNYLKLPAYSSEEVMRRQLRYCIREGQFSFHLS